MLTMDCLLKRKMMKMTDKIQTDVDAYSQKEYRFKLIEDTDEGGYVISSPDLPGCISCGETVEEAIANGEDAKREWLYAAMESGVHFGD